MSEDVRVCSREGCGRKLRSDNKTGMCAKCQAGRKLPAGVGAPAAPAAKAPKPKRVKPPPSSELPVEERFAMVFRGLGKDPDGMVRDFMEACLGEVTDALEKSDVKALAEE